MAPIWLAWVGKIPSDLICWLSALWSWKWGSAKKKARSEWILEMFDGQLNVPTWTLKNFDDFIPFLLKRMIIGYEMY